MKSTGEVMGLDIDFRHAFAKSQIAAGMDLPSEGTIFISVKNSDKERIVEVSRDLINLGFKIVATGGTKDFLTLMGIEVQRINKVLEGRPHCVDALINGDVKMVINTTEGTQAIEDSFSIRRTALNYNVAYYTTVTAARAAVSGIAAIREGALDVAPLQSYFSL